MLDFDYKMSASTPATSVSVTAPLCSVADMIHSAKLPKLNNPNVSLNVTTANSLVSNLLAVESACTTPRTPEILNSLIAMTNPLDDYNYNASEKCATGGPRSVNDSTSNSSGSPLGSPANSSTPSIQKTCSQLIKAGLKLSIESKRKMSGSDGSEGVCSKRLKKEEPYISDDEYDDISLGNQTDGLTPEDEERRRRRRERNKIAATKCRLKKRERTVNLVSESENLETQNIDLKTQIQELEVQRRQLVDMLSHHSPTCLKNMTNNTSSPTTPYNPIQPPYDSPTSYPSSTTPYEPNSPYIRPESANVLASSYNCDIENPPSNFNQPVDPLDIATPYNSMGTPTSDGNYMRQDDANFVVGDSFSKNSNMMLVDSSQNEYTEQMQFDSQDVNSFHYNGHAATSTAQQCHNVNTGGGRRNKFRNTGMDNGCLA
ncbi:activating transcription factor 3 [Arctopsyche grandis]|uniref:activating transcription factor 3 n=1 Tax=Arctopsyche grandis TaxID=121162 RepID=UPI00406DA4B6